MEVAPMSSPPMWRPKRGKIIQALEERDLGAGVQAVEEHIDGSLADIAAAAEKSGDERESSEVDVTK